jgi:hypothetical protein
MWRSEHLRYLSIYQKSLVLRADTFSGPLGKGSSLAMLAVATGRLTGKFRWTRQVPQDHRGSGRTACHPPHVA